MFGAFLFLLATYLYFSPRRYFSIFILLALATGGFQFVPLPLMTLSAAGVTKTYDWLLLFTGLILLLRPQTFLDLAVWKSFKVLVLYGILLLGLLFYSIFIREVEVSVSVRVFRNLIYFVTLFLFIPLSLEELKKIFRLVIYVTSFASVIYCLQLVVHTSLLNMVTSDDVVLNENGLLKRYYNLPVFICPVLFFLFIEKGKIAVKHRRILLALNGLAILLSQHRNLLLALFACYILYLLMSNKLKLKNVFAYAILCIGVIAGANQVLGDRFSKGFNDIAKTSFKVSRTDFDEVALTEISTTQFRQLLLLERLEFISKDDALSLFGIGLVTDDSYKAKALDFSVGLPDEEGNIIQIASGDIVWSVLLLQLGIVGAFVFILFNLSLLAKFFSRRFDSYMQVGVLYIVCLIITSFYGTMIVLPYVTTFLMLFGAYYYNYSKSIFSSTVYESN
jgi:hypothetical protein